MFKRAFCARYTHMKEHASDQSRILVTDLSQMNRREIKKKTDTIAFKIWTAVPRVEEYKIDAAVQILEDYPLYLLFRDDSLTRGLPTISVTGHRRILSYVYANETI